MRVPLLIGWVVAGAALLPACIERSPGSERIVSGGSTSGAVSSTPALSRAAMPDVLATSLPAIAHPVGAVFDRQIELLGYNARPEPAPQGGEVQVTVYYRALEDITDDWEIFVHAGDESKGQQRFNVDHWPARGRLRTNAWHKGDIIKDDWSFTYPSGTPSIDLWTGFFREDDRMPLTSVGRGGTDGTNRLHIGTIVSQ